MAASQPLSWFAKAFGRAVRDDSGQGIVEYAIILAFVATVAIVTLRVFGQRTNNMLSPAQNGFS